MAKHTVFSATLVLLFTMAVAFEVRNLVPVNQKCPYCIEVDPCEEKLQKAQTDYCDVYLRSGTSCSSSPPLVMVTEEASSWREAFLRCCDQLEDINKKCRCEAIEKVVIQQTQSGQLEGIDEQEMLKTAQSLPLLCRLKKALPCNITIPASTPTGEETGTGTGKLPSQPLF